MKVKIGPYIPWHTTTGIEYWYLEKRFKKHVLTVSEDEFNAFDDFVITMLDRVQWLLNGTINKLHAMRKRKVVVKLDPYDTWSADETLAYIIVPVLVQLKLDKQGAPFLDAEDVPEELRPTEEEVERFKKTGDTDDKFFDRWDWVLDEMIFAFQAKTSDWEDQFFSGDPKFRSEPVEGLDGFHELAEDEKSTFKVDTEGRKAYHERMTNGFRLFGKYYESLWS